MTNSINTYFAYSKHTKWTTFLSHAHYRLLFIMTHFGIRGTKFEKFYNSQSQSYNVSKLEKADLLVVLVKDETITYGMKSEIEIAERLGMPILMYNTDNDTFYRKGSDYYIRNNAYMTRMTDNYRETWDLSLATPTTNSNIAGYIIDKVNAYQRKQQNKEKMAKQYQIDTNKVFFFRQNLENIYMTSIFTDKILNLKQSLKEWNEMGYKKKLLKLVEDYKICYFGDTKWSTAVEVRVYKDKTVAYVEGGKTEIPIEQWKEVAAIRDIKVGKWNVCVDRSTRYESTIRIGCKIGTFNEIEHILKAHKSLQ